MRESLTRLRGGCFFSTWCASEAREVFRCERKRYTKYRKNKRLTAVLFSFRVKKLISLNEELAYYHMCDSVCQFYMNRGL